MDNISAYGIPVNIENTIILIEWIVAWIIALKNLRNKQTPVLMWCVNAVAICFITGVFVSDCDAYYRGYVSYFDMHLSCTPRDLALATWNDRGGKMLFYPLVPVMCSVHKISWLIKYREQFL